MLIADKKKTFDKCKCASAIAIRNRVLDIEVVR